MRDCLFEVHLVQPICRNVRDSAFKLLAKELEINPLGTMRLIPTPSAPDKAT